MIRLRRRSSRVLLALGLMGAVATPAAAQMARETYATARPAITPIIRLPGRDGRLSQARFSDGLRQVILLTTPGASQPDRIEVSLRLDSAPGTGPSLEMARPTKQGIAAELEQAFPGQIMGVVTRDMRNSYGPFGLAVGDQCLYAWQWLDSASAGGQSDRGRLFGPNGSHAVSLRIRACRSANRTIPELVSAIERLTIADVSAAPAVESAIIRAPVRAVVRRPRPAPKPTAEPPVALERPVAAPPAAVVAPARLVPSPSAVELPRAEPRPGMRRFLVPDGQVAVPATAPVPVTPDVARPVAPGMARRYITDPPPSQSDNLMGGLVPRSNAAGAPAPDPVSDLPARALQPGGRPNTPPVGLR